jgi:prepilin-type N-terminal cleavage/methylation domain-containing protein
MKVSSNKAKAEAFTLIELLVVIFILAILMALVLPTTTPRGSGYLYRCVDNQNQIAIGFTAWESDHNGQFPWQVSSTNGGTMEYAARGYAAPNFQILSNYVKSPTSFICPTDKAKIVATNGKLLNNQNVSYFAAFDAGTNNAVNILTGDRHLENNGKPVKPGLFIYSTGAVMNWDRELHGNFKNCAIGVLSFTDGRVEIVRDANLKSIFQREGVATNYLAVP